MKTHQVSIKAKCGHVVINSFKFKPSSDELKQHRAIQKSKPCPRCEVAELMKEGK